LAEQLDSSFICYLDANAQMRQLDFPRMALPLLMRGKLFADDFERIEAAVVQSIEFPRTVFPRL